MRTIFSFILALVSCCGHLAWGFVPSYENAPRPGFMPDEVLVLDQSLWEFAVGDGPRREPRQVRNLLFPHHINFGFSPESDLSGVDYENLRNPGSKDVVWYQKSVTLPLDWKGALLTFEGVDYESEVYVNGQYAASHKGAYAPFDVNLSPFFASAKKTEKGFIFVITLRAEDDRLARNRAVGKQERKPYEGVIFYGNSTGAWKGTYLRKIHPDHFIAQFLHETNSSGKFKYKVELSGKNPGPFEVQIAVSDRASKKVLAKDTVHTGFKNKVHGEFIVPSARSWFPDSPVLYNVEILLTQKGVVLERMRSYAGFSDFVQKKGHFYLNQTPFYLRGVLNQMVYPKGLYTPEKNDNALDLMMIRKHGFNFQRVHQTTPRWRDIYEMENGVMVDGKRLGVLWTLEMPSARDLRDSKAFAQFQAEWKEIIRAYGHGHPGLIYFVPMNEDWGLLEDDDHWSPVSNAQREKAQLFLLQETLKVAPSNALVSPGDGWRQITGIKNGAEIPGINPNQLILSAHDYRGSARDLITAYSHLPVNAPRGSAFPRNGKELILQGYEFPGADVAPVLGEFGGKSYAPPWLGNVFGYGQVYRDLILWSNDALLQFKAMGELKIFRGGYVYTQVRDAGFKPHRPPTGDRPAGELNGFLFADGVPKVSPELWYEANLINQSIHDTNRALYETLEGPLMPNP